MVSGIGKAPCNPCLIIAIMIHLDHDCNDKDHKPPAITTRTNSIMHSLKAMQTISLFGF